MPLQPPRETLTGVATEESLARCGLKAPISPRKRSPSRADFTNRLMLRGCSLATAPSWTDFTLVGWEVTGDGLEGEL